MGTDKERTFGTPIFVENKGQWGSNVLYRAKLPKGFVFITKNGLGYVFFDQKPFEKDGHYHQIEGKPEGRLNGEAIRVNFKNIQPISRTFGAGKSSTPMHFIKNNHSYQNITTFSEVLIPNLYPQIDWRIYTTLTGEIKYEFIVQPGGDPSKILIEYDGIQSLSTEQGALLVEGIFETVKEKKPIVYFSNNKNNPIEAKYNINPEFPTALSQPSNFPTKHNKQKLKRTSQKNTHLKSNTRYMTFDLDIPDGPLDQKLIIDPILVFSTYSGSFSDNWGFTATFGENETAYSGGISFGSGFPSTTGAFDILYADSVDVGILKYSADGKNLLHATFLGGRGLDVPHSMIMDGDENLVIFGTTGSTDFPTTLGAHNRLKSRGKTSYSPSALVTREAMDIYVSKISKDGSTLLASTLIGGTGMDGILVKGIPNLGQNGVLHRNYGDDFRGDVAIDELNNIYVTTVVESTDFPTKGIENPTFGGGVNDGLILKYNTQLSTLEWGRYLGGNGDDAIYGIEYNSTSKELFIVGGTSSSNLNFPNAIAVQKTPLGNIDGFVMVINADDGKVKRGTYLGTNSYDQAYFVELDSNNNLFILGQTEGLYPVSPNVYNNPSSGIFIHKIQNNLETSLLSTVIGAGRRTPDISPTAFLVNECDNIFITGYGNPFISVPITGDTRGLPVTSDAFQTTTDGADFYLVNLKKDFEKLLYATYFGGGTVDANGRPISVEHVDGGTSRFDKKGVVYHAVCAGCGGTNDFPTTAGSYSVINRAPNCNNAIFKFDLASLKASFETFDNNGENEGITTACVPATIKFEDRSIGGETYTWNFGDGTIINQKGNVQHFYDTPGDYNVTLTIFDENTCTNTDSFTKTLFIRQDSYTVAPGKSICVNDPFELSVTGAAFATWKDGSGNIISNQSKFIVNPKVDTDYTIEGETPSGCPILETVSVKVKNYINVDFSIFNLDTKENNINTACLPVRLEFINQSTNGISYLWDFGDGTQSTNPNTPEHTYDQPGVYTITLTATNPEACQPNASRQVNITILDPNIRIPDQITVCKGENFSLNANGLINPVWRQKDGTILSTESTLTFTPEQNQQIEIVGSSGTGCPFFQTIDVKVIDLSIIKLEIIAEGECLGSNNFMVQLINTETGQLINKNNENIAFSIDMGDGRKYTSPSFSHEYESKGNYTVTVALNTKTCADRVSRKLFSPSIFVPNVVTRNGDNKNEKFVINSYIPLDIIIFNRWGRKVSTFENYNNEWPDASVTEGWYFFELSGENQFKCNGWVHVIGQGLQTSNTN